MRASTIYAWTLTDVDRGNSKELRIFLVEPPRPGNFFPGVAGKKGSMRLAKPEKGEKDVGPLKAASASCPFLVLRAARDSGGSGALEAAFDAVVSCSSYLQKRKRKNFPSPAPESFQPNHLADAMADLVSGAPLALPTQHAFIETELTALVELLNGQLEFVHSRGLRGRPIRRTCDSCKRPVFLNQDDRYCLVVDGGYPADAPIHELCIRPAPRAQP